MKRFLSLLLSVVMALSIVPVAFAEETVSEPKGYITISVEATTLGLGYIHEPMKIPFYEGDNYANVTERYFQSLDMYYEYTGKAGGGSADKDDLSGFYLSCIDDGRTCAEREALINVPQYIQDASGQTNQDFIEWGGWDNILGEFDYCTTAGWMYTIAQEKDFPGYGVSQRNPVDGDVMRWQFTLYGLGADLGSTLMGGDGSYGGEDSIIPLTDRDELIALVGAINAASNKEEILAQDGAQADFDEAIALLTDLKNTTKEQLDAKADELAETSNIGYDYIAEAGTTKTTVPGATVIPGQAADLSTGETTEPTIPTTPTTPSVDAALEHLDKTLAWLSTTYVPAPAFGTNAGEWTVLSLARGGAEVPENYYEDYLDRIYETVADKINATGGLHSVKLTENSRLILALSSIGVEPYDIGGYDVLDALADFKTVPKQGINGPVFALIAMDTNNYEFKPEYFDDVTAGYENSRTKMIEYILGKETVNHGWALTGTNPDPDMTAMTIQALSSYYNGNDLLKAEFTDETAYNEMIAKIKAAVDRGVEALGNLQQDDGDFKSWGTQNLESTAQVVVALTALGINPIEDPRFITETGKTLVDGMMKYAIADGGFSHTFDNDPANPGANGGVLNGMATDQGTYGLVALKRYLEGENKLYGMTDAFEDDTTTPPTPVVPQADVIITTPEQIVGEAGTEFKAVVTANTWSENTLKLIDGVYNVPAGLEVVDVTMGSNVTGGELQFNLVDGKLRFAYMSNELGDITLSTETFPIELMTITLKLTESVEEETSFEIAAESLSLKTTSEAASEALDVENAKDTVIISVPAPEVEASARVLYIGDDTDLIPATKQAVAVEFLNLQADSKVIYGETELMYSEEMTEKKGVDTYVAIVDSTVTIDDLNDMENYTITEETPADITFADVNEDEVVNAQDALNTLSFWLRKTEVETDKEILTANVNADGAITTVDVLAIMECVVNARELDIIAK